MGFDAMKDNRAESAKFMVDEITNVCKECGKRAPGSEGEKKAVEYMGNQLKPYCDDVRMEPFDVYPAAFMGWIYLSVTMYIIGLAAFFFQPIATLVLFIAATVIMVLEFVLYKRFVDKLFVKKTSYNLLAVKHPTGDVKRRVFFNGHPDAACEWTFNYHLGGAGFIAHLVISFIGLFYFFAVTIVAIVNRYAPFTDALTVQILGYVCLAFLPLWIGIYFMWNEKRIVDGANDNLTGCYMGIAVLKALKDNGVNLENTEVGVLLTGSEEAGLRGAKAFCEAHKKDYKDVETIIFSYDTIHDGKYLGVNVRDLNNTVPSDPHAVELFYNAANEVKVPISKIGVPLGATDSAAFNQGGFKCVGITAMNHVLEDYYHTRKDSYDNLDEEGLANCFAASVQALEDFDNGL